jgi:hypothetical protein
MSSDLQYTDMIRRDLDESLNCLPDESNVHSHLPVKTRAFQAEKHAIGDRSPSRIRVGAVSTNLVQFLRGLHLSKSEARVLLGAVFNVPHASEGRAFPDFAT